MPCSTTSGLPLFGCCAPANLGVVSVHIAQPVWSMGFNPPTTVAQIDGMLQTAYSFLLAADYPSAVDGRHTVDSYTVDPGTTDIYIQNENFDCGELVTSNGFAVAGFCAYRYYVHFQFGYVLDFSFRKTKAVITGQAGACLRLGELSTASLFGPCQQGVSFEFLSSQNTGVVDSTFELISTYDFRNIGEQPEIIGRWAHKVTANEIGNLSIPEPCDGTP